MPSEPNMPRCPSTHTGSSPTPPRKPAPVYLLHLRELSRHLHIHPRPQFTYISSPLSPTPTGPPLHPPHPPLPHFIPITTASIHHGHLQRNNLCRRKFSGIRWVSERSHISHGSDAHLSSYLHLCSQPMTISLLK